jgi:hypothetical protein
MTTPTPFRAITAAALLAAGTLALAGCSGGPGGARTPTPSATSAVVGKEVSQTCEELVPASAFTVYGKAFTLDTDAKPEKGSPAAIIAGQRGRVCVFRSGEVTVTVAVAHLPAKTLTSLEDALYEQSNSVPTYGVEGYFRKAGAVGRADAFVDPYWVNARSTMFGEPGDAEPVMTAVRTALSPAAG